MIMHVPKGERDFELGQIHKGRIYFKEIGWVEKPFMAIEFVTQEDFRKYVVETFGEDYYNPELFEEGAEFIRISID